MSFVEWTVNLSIRVPEMDKQHQQLVAILNEYHDAAKAGNGPDTLGGIMDRLVSYTKTHLSNEEQFLESIDYAFINSHKTEHRKLTEQVMQLKTQYDSGDSTVGTKLLNLLRDWLENHILRADRMYADYYLKQVAAKSKAKATV